MDLKSFGRWYEYSRARDEMFRATDTSWAPWYIADSNDKRGARLNVITHMLSKIPYKEIKREAIKLPKRQKRGDYVDPKLPLKRVPDIA